MPTLQMGKWRHREVTIHVSNSGAGSRLTDELGLTNILMVSAGMGLHSITLGGIYCHVSLPAEMRTNVSSLHIGH